MSVINLKAITDKLSIGALAIGNFDGVHLGHQGLLAVAVEESKKMYKDSGVLTFSPHPKEFFNPEMYNRIFEQDQNYKLIQSFGVTNVLLQDFNQEVSALSAQEFLSSVFRKVEFKALVVGFDFKLGKERGGDHNDVQTWCDENNVLLNVVSCESFEGEKISSSRMKSFLLNGDVANASDLLGFPYSHKSLIKADQGLGRQMGFPTLNMHLSPDISIKRGVYSTTCIILNKRHQAISNIGFRPTVSGETTKLVLETHILDESFFKIEDGVEVEVVFGDFIRSEKKFVDINELKAQIQADVRVAKGLLD